MPRAEPWRSRIVGEGAEDPEQLLANPRNFRIHPRAQQDALAGVLDQVGWVQRVIVNRRTGHVLDGHLRVSLAITRREPEVPVLYVDLEEAEERLVLATLDPLAALAVTDFEQLDALLAEVEAADPALQALLESLSRAPAEAPPLAENLQDQSAFEKGAERGSLFSRFLVPTFSVLDARQGYWQDRKRAWLSLGIASLLGRENLNGKGFRPPGIYNGRPWNPQGVLVDENGRRQYVTNDSSPGRHGVSVFDPVLCEIAYSWFCPPGGSILDPFAGGSVRGIVAAALGRRYVGVDLRRDQIAENEQQWAAIGPTLRVVPSAYVEPEDYCPELTPVERRGAYWFKRDDLYAIAGARGGKARACWLLAQGASGLTTAGSRSSPQANIVAQVARRLGIPARIHTPSGDAGAELEMAVQAGAERISYYPPATHNSAIIAGAREDALLLGYREIPSGMECEEAVAATRSQAANLPPEARRLVVPVGSGMSLAGILWGLKDAGLRLPVLGVQVGADPTERLDTYAPPDWRDTVTLVRSSREYAEPVRNCVIEGLRLDPIYEAKCAEYLQEGDCLWVVGLRASEPTEAEEQAEAPAPRWIEGDSLELFDLVGAEPATAEGYDFLFSCPPYADLEIYSRDPRDVSNMPYAQFLDVYRAVIAQSARLLREDRFACFVVGEVRDRAGLYRNFIGATVQAFLDAGLAFYNEAILVTSVGSASYRAGGHFASGRKLEKTHQNVLVFVKGDPKRATEACGPVALLAPAAVTASSANPQELDPPS